MPIDTVTDNDNTYVCMDLNIWLSGSNHKKIKEQI